MVGRKFEISQSPRKSLEKATQVIEQKKESSSQPVISPRDPSEDIRAQFNLVSEELEIDEAENEGIVLSSQFLGPDHKSGLTTAKPVATSPISPSVGRTINLDAPQTQEAAVSTETRMLEFNAISNR